MSPAATTARPAVGVDLRALVGTPSGIGVFTRALLLRLAERGGYRIVGLSHRPATGGGELEAAGVALETRAAPLGVLWQQLRLPARLAAGDLDLFWSPLFTLPLRLPVPAVVTVHDLTPVLYPETHRFKVLASILPFLRRSVETARVVVADSEATARDLRGQFPQCADRLRVVYPGVDDDFAPGGAEEVAATREELGCPRGYVLYAGTIEPRKNLGLLLDAWEAARLDDATFPPLVLAGGYGWRSRPLVRRIERLRGLGLLALGRVERGRLVRLFQAARVFAYPSLYEGFGLPPAEAMACGVPTVASNRASLPEVVGEAGLLVDADDPGGLADALRRVIGDPALAAELGARGRERARRFRWTRAAREMEEVFALALQ